jgi:hypothetical protein
MSSCKIENIDSSDESDKNVKVSPRTKNDNEDQIMTSRKDYMSTETKTLEKYDNKLNKINHCISLINNVTNDDWKITN